MRENHRLLVEQVIELIEGKLTEPVSLETLSNETGFSKFYLLRLFKSITEQSVMSYVRVRRLSVSLTDLLNSNLNILDIAVKYQFGYEQSYIRSFQNQFHMTPSKYRKTRGELKIEPKIDINSLTSLGQGLIIRPSVIIKPEFFIHGRSQEIIHEQNYHEANAAKLAHTFYNEDLQYIPNRKKDNIYIGFVSYRNNNDISDDYIPSVETSCLNKVHPPFAVYHIPHQEYAVFRYLGFHSPAAITYRTLKELYDYIECWKENTAYIQTGPYHFERMDLHRCSEEYCEMDIFIPIGELKKMD